MTDEHQVPGTELRTRRTLLLGAGAVGASVALAACGSDDDESSGGPGGGAAPTTGAPATEPTATEGAAEGTGPVVAKASEVPVGGGRIIAAQQLVVTQPTAGEFKAFNAICPHQGCLVANVDGGTINCTCHVSRFSIIDGSVKSGPAKQPLTARPVKLDGENITLG